MHVKRLVAVLLTALLPVALTACGQATAASVRPERTIRAPEGAYAVGVRTLTLGADTDRPLPVTIWYPATATGAVAAGRFPVVLYSHGLHSLPELHAELTTRWTAAGFVVAAPTYPHTSRSARRFTRAAVRHQPADGWRVIQHLIRLERTRGEPFAGHLDTSRIAAAGHSAGGFTTTGMFTSGHSARLRAGIVIAGGGLAGSFAGPPATLLFVHGGADPIVPASVGRAAYERVGWPKAFLTLTGQGHGEYLTPGRSGFAQVLATTTDFLRWTLYDDQAAGRRIPAGARSAGITSFDNGFRRPARQVPARR